MAEATETEATGGHQIEVPPWAMWAAGTAGTAIIGLFIALVWGLFAGGIDSYVRGQAQEVVNAGELTDDGSTQSAKISELTTAVSNLTTAIEQQSDRDREFRTDVRSQLSTLTSAMLELARD